MKRKGKQPVLHADDDKQYTLLHEVIAMRNQNRESKINAQEYTDHMQTAYESYSSAMKKIRENLETAKQGLVAIDEKGLSDKIIAAIDGISEIRKKQMETVSSYTAQMASYDSVRVSFLRENGDKKDQFVLDHFDDRMKQKNVRLRKHIGELDRQYQDLETDLYRDEQGKHKDPTDEELLSVKRKMDQVLEEKQKAMTEYAEFMQRMAVSRDEILQDEPDMDAMQVIEKHAVNAKEEAGKFADAFSNANQAVQSRWEHFKTLPVITPLVAGTGFIRQKLSPKFDHVKSDFLAGYAAMKENRQMRKVEHNLSELDKLHGKTGEDSYLSRFKSSLESDPKEREQEILVPDDPVQSSASETEPVVDISVTEVPVILSEKEIHENRVRRAGNAAVLSSLDETGLRRIINDYYWTDTSEAHDIATKLHSSDNAVTDLNQYVGHVKAMISHWPNATFRDAMTEKLDKAMEQTYAKKVQYEKKVSQAEARIRDSEEFLSGLDTPLSVSSGYEGPEI